MKTKFYVGSLLLAAALVRAQTNDLTALLQQGLLEEQANRNFDAAIAAYQSLALQFDKDRQLAATAVFRLGECYRAQGRTNEAAAQYQRILHDFSDQQTLATLSRQDLAGMGLAPAGAGKTPVQAEGSGSIPASAEASVLATQISGIDKLKADPEEQARAVLAIFPDDLLKQMLLRLPNIQAQAARMEANPQMSYAELAGTRGYSVAISSEAELLRKELREMHGTNLLADARSELSQQRQGIAERVAFILGIQKARLKALQVAAGPEAAESEAAHPVTDEESKEIQRIQQMLQNSPDLITGPSSGELNGAAHDGALRVATFLLDHGADVNAKQNGETPLTAAALNAQKAMVELLLSRGADVNARGSSGGTALVTAAAAGYQAVAEMLLAHQADVNARNSKINNEETALHRAARNGHQGIASLLLEHKADVNAQNGAGATPLCLAVQGGQTKIIQMLLTAGADANLKDGDGRTALNYAIGASPEVFQTLLAAGINPNTEDTEGRTPLSYAAERDSPNVVKLLLAAKADPNGGKIDVPLLAAMKKGDATSAELLLQAGANPNAIGTVDGAGKANRRGFSGASKKLVTPLYFATTEGQLPLVRRLLKYHADPNDSQIDGESLLFRTLAETNILAALLEAGARVDAVTKDEANWTPLGVAAKNNNAAAVKILLEHGANPNVRNANGATPLHWAAYGPADREVFELLLAHQADPNVRNSNGQTPLEVLKKSGTQSNSALRPGMPPSLPRGPGPGGMVGIADSKPKPLAGELADVLREHGARDKLPDWDSITVSRPAADFAFPILHQGTNDWNQFTLLETIFNFYNSLQSYSVPQGNNTWAGYQVNGMLPFADLSRVTIVRPAHDSTNETCWVVNLVNGTNGIEVSKDLPLEFGDVVEIPERDHALNERAAGLTDSQRATLAEYANATAQLIAHGQKVELPFWRLDGQATLGCLLNKPEAQKLLLASSDLSRVKVTRHDPRTGQAHEWILDGRLRPSFPNGIPGAPALPYQWNPGANNSAPAPGLWLRDGDVIEVPEKP